MTGPRVPIEAQIAEIGNVLAVPPRTDRAMDQAMRVQAQRAIQGTLEFCRDNGPVIREYLAARNQERLYQIIDGRLCWRRKDGVGGDDYTPIPDGEANVVLKVLCGAAAD